MKLSVMLEQLSSGMLRSMEIFFLTLIFSLPLGLLISFGRMSKNKILRTIIKVYISVMRGTPLMLQLLVVYFGPYYLFGMQIGGTYRFTAIILGFALNYAHILQRFTGQESSRCRSGNTRRRGCLDTVKHSASAASFSLRS